MVNRFFVVDIILARFNKKVVVRLQQIDLIFVNYKQENLVKNKQFKEFKLRLRD